jgi:hypothetical protein
MPTVDMPLRPADATDSLIPPVCATPTTESGVPRCRPRAAAPLRSTCAAARTCSTATARS